MNIAIHIAANKLGTHPFNLILRVSQMVSSLNDCWPEIDEGLVDTIRTIDNPKTAALDLPHRFDLPIAKATSLATRDTDVLLSQDSIRVLDKLTRKSFWGVRNITSESLTHVTRLGSPELEAAVKELLDSGLILSKFSRRGPFSLNPSRKEGIEAILRRLTTASPNR